MSTLEHVHFIGIGGYGMSAIARVMLEMGYRVSGSDVLKKDLTDKLEAEGARVFIGHEADHVKGADLVVYSTACAADNVERIAAKEWNIPILHRSQMLARLMEDKRGIAVAGAHGKTTTSSMIAMVMEDCDLDPTYIIGGEIMNIGSNAKAGKGEYVVAEADESDGSFLQYRPEISIVTNIEADHLENYDGDFAKLKQAFVTFLGQVKPNGCSVVGLDDRHIRELLPQIQGEVVTFGIDSEDVEFRAENLVLGDRRVSFDVVQRGATLGQLDLSVPGKHNVYNALATCVICLRVGIPFAEIARTISGYQGTKRRFQVLGDIRDILVIDDYAHHPTEIQATIAAAKATGKRILAVFQPQRYSRTFYLLDAFSRSFQDADEVILTEIYSPAGEEKIEGVDSSRLAEMIRQNSNPNVRYFKTKEDVQEWLADYVQSGDLVLTMGAGDIWKAAKGLVLDLEQMEENSKV